MLVKATIRVKNKMAPKAIPNLVLKDIV